MPAGVTWSQYISFSAAAAISMFLGSQLVHNYYRPLEDLDVYIEKELKYLPDDLQEKMKKELEDEGFIKCS